MLAPLAALQGAETKPNIIFILADDLGIGGVSSYGEDHFKTPNIDRLPTAASALNIATPRRFAGRRVPC